VEFSILGPLEARDGADAVPVSGSKQRALLALLLLHANDVVSSDRLLDELWPGEPPQSGVTALQVRVSQLRKALGGAPFLETRAPGYLLRVAPDGLDLHRFERLTREAHGAEPARAAALLREALALWRGPPLAEFAYDSFAQAAIGRLVELRLAALERRIDADLALARHADVVPELEELVREHPLRERLRGQLMLALYRCGRQADALEAFQSSRRMLVDGLGIEPGRPLRDLEARILRQDPELDLVPADAEQRSILVAAIGTPHDERLVALGAQLVRRPGREAILLRLVGSAGEVAAAADALDAVRTGLQADGLAVRAAVFASPDPARDVVRMAVEQDVDLVLCAAPWEPLAEAPIAELLRDAPCDVALVVPRASPGDAVLVPFVGAEHDWVAVELGAWIAVAAEAPLVLAGPADGAAGRDASRLLASASLAVQRALGVAARPLLLEPGADALVSATSGARVVVVGLSDRWRKDGLGTARQALATGSRATVVFVRRGLRPGGLAPREALTRFTWSVRG
jgi:DNA-binding SARP family transcriptional activator